MAATSTSATPLNGAPAAMVDSDMPVTSARSIRVFSLGDHELVWRGLTDLLMVTDDLITQAASAGDALRRIPAAAPDVALLDAMPEAVPRSLEPAEAIERRASRPGPS
jgi:DNA-binding NarL/FixJ family response regulator